MGDQDAFRRSLYQNSCIGEKQIAMGDLKIPGNKSFGVDIGAENVCEIHHARRRNIAIFRG